MNFYKFLKISKNFHKFRDRRELVSISFYQFLLIAGFIFIFNFIFGNAVSSQINSLLNFTGKITNTDGSELADGNYDMTFSLYDAPTGGSAVWTETLNSGSRFAAEILSSTSTATGVLYTYTGESATTSLRIGQYLTNSTATSSVLIVDYNTSANTITVASGSPVWTASTTVNNRPWVEGGVINENLGSVNDLDSVDFSQPLYLEVIFNGETMQPRKRMDTVSQAFDAINLGGKSETDYATLDEDETITGAWTFNNNVNIATSSLAAALTVTQSGSGDIIDIQTATGSAFKVLADGRVRIGDFYMPTTDGSPGYVLKTDGAGDVYWAVDMSGSGPSGSDFIWATSTDNSVAFPYDSNLVVVIGNIATTTMSGNIFEVDGSALFDTVNVSNQSEIRFYDSDSSNYMGIRASNTINTNFILTMPADAGTDGLALVTDGNGNLRWDSPTTFIYALAGTQGQIAYYGASGSQLSGTSSLFIADSGNISAGTGLSVGTSTANGLLSVGNIFGSQFLVDASGNVVGGTWMADTIDTAHGGTGTTTWAANSLVYAPADNALSQILPGTAGYVLKMDSGVPTWMPDLTVGGEYSHWASSSDNLLIRPTDISQVVVVGADATSTDIGQILEVAGDSYFSGAINANTLSLVNALAVGSGGTGSSTPSGLLYGDGAGNIASVANNSANWNTTYSWGDHSIQNYFSTSTGRILEVAYGGIGTTTFEANSLIYASADDVISQILPGTNGYALVMQGGVPTWASTSPATPHDLLSAFHSDATPGVVARGDLITGQGADPTWSKLALGGDGYILRSNGSDVVWSTTTAITALGTINAGTWEADVVSEEFGGTGQGTWDIGDIVFASSSNDLMGLPIGTAGHILQSVSGRPRWVSTTSLGIDFSGVGGTVSTEQGGTEADSSGWNGMVRVVGGNWGVVNGSTGQVAYWSDNNTIAGENQLAVSRGGTGQDFSGATTGFVYVNSGTMSASATIATVLTDLTDDGSGVVLTGNVLSLDTTGNWSGAFDNQEGSYYLNAVNLTNFNIPFAGALAGTTTSALDEGSNLYWTQQRFDIALNSTTTDALDEGSNNLYWTQNRFDAALLSTSSIGSLTDLPNLQTVGTITAGTWNADTIAVNRGGTGLTSYTADAILYASDANTIGQIAPGTNGYVLKMTGGTPDWQPDLKGNEILAWATTSNDLLIYPRDITDVVVIGANSTSSINTIFEVAGNAFFSGTIDADTLSLVNALAVSEGGTGSTSPSGFLLGDGAGNIVSAANNSTDWNTAYSWGDHGTQNYFSTSSDLVLEVDYGGTGRDTWTANSLVYASAENTLGQITPGTNGYALIMQGGVPTWSSTTIGAAHGILSSQHSDVEATSSLERGDLMVGSSSNKWTRLALGSEGYILRSVGGDPTWVPTVNITELGTITTGTWNADTIDIANGGTGATTATGARANLDLDEIYKFGINSTGTVGYIWQSDGDGRGLWAPEGAGQKALFIGTTTYTTNGAFATGTLAGYAAANNICDSEFPGSFFCRTYDIITSINEVDISAWGDEIYSAWMAEGPPGYTSDSNDCKGWTDSTADYLGAYWKFQYQTGGSGWLIHCGNNLSLACCSWQ